VKEFSLHQELWLPLPREKVFPFFADAANLEAITPSFLNFVVLTPAPIVMRVGTRIDYNLRVHGLPLRWQSEITAWEPPHRFVDEQRRGPYRLWIHEHRFEERDGGTLCVDHVRYAVFGGRLIEKFFVRRDLGRIFAYRQSRIRELLKT
jgi:ligand-binding SRPBCC domain-containing protein